MRRISASASHWLICRQLAALCISWYLTAQIVWRLIWCHLAVVIVPSLAAHKYQKGVKFFVEIKLEGRDGDFGYICNLG